MPYGDPVYLLDLCILAYQLHAQTLVMRADPYGEYMRSKTRAGDAAHIKGRKRRKRFLEAVGEVIRGLQRPQAGPSLGGPGYMRNPGSPAWPVNDDLDPIVSDYTRISPHLPGLVQQYKEHEGWIIYRAPTSITSTIGHVFMSEYDANQGPNPQPGMNPLCHVNRVPPVPWINAPPGGRDLLYCFEGGTGAIRNRATDGAIWSLMGFVLAHEDTTSNAVPRPYDIFIVFRGSRSGRLSKLYRATASLFLSRGNPDWVTDLDLPTTKARPDVSPASTHRGFATALQTMLPTIEAALRHLVQQNAHAPANIHVTGHSLGGALATCFGSAVACGTFGPRVQQVTPGWQWGQMSVTTFGAPPAGWRTFATDFNTAYRGRADRWRLEEDVVPKKILTLPHWTATGNDISLETNLSDEESHSPDHIRDVMQPYLLHHRAYLRQPDQEKPWKVETDLEQLLLLLEGELSALATRGWFNFKKGLDLYLTALCQMKEDVGQAGLGPGFSDRFTSTERATIQGFIMKFSGGQQIDPGQFFTFMQQEATKVLRITKIQEDEDLCSLIRAWLGLVAAEDGYRWQRNDRNLSQVKR